MLKQSFDHIDWIFSLVCESAIWIIISYLKPIIMILIKQEIAAGQTAKRRNIYIKVAKKSENA